MPNPDHRMSTPIATESTGSIQYLPVARMTQPPTMTAPVESVSPISCSNALRMLTSLPGAIEQQRDHAVHHHAGRSHPDHHAGMNVLGILQAAKRFIENEARNRHQRNRIHQRRQHSSPVIAISLGGTGRAGLQVNRGQRKQQGKKIRQIVPGFGEQRQRMGANAGNDQQTQCRRR